jgi:hypothetical protein
MNWEPYLLPYLFGTTPMEELIKEANTRGWYICHISQDLKGLWNCQLWAPDLSIDLYRRKITPMVCCSSLQAAIEESISRIPLAKAPEYAIHQGNLGAQPKQALTDLLGLVQKAISPTKPIYRRI